MVIDMPINIQWVLADNVTTFYLTVDYSLVYFFTLAHVFAFFSVIKLIKIVNIHFSQCEWVNADNSKNKN